MNFRKCCMLVGASLLAVTLTAGVATAAPGKSKGNQFGKLAAKACADERKALGNDAFEELYGTPATPNCIGVKGEDAAPALKAASKACKTERADIGVEAFNEKYGSNKNKKNALGKCVSAKSGKKVKAAVNESAEKVMNFAKLCKAEQADPAFAASHDGKTFDQFYGTNSNLKNAFGKCVSFKAKTSEPAPTA